VIGWNYYTCFTSTSFLTLTFAGKEKGRGDGEDLSGFEAYRAEIRERIYSIGSRPTDCKKSKEKSRA
jgi:hypothetical protein